jgi:hypothetical protein
MIWLLPVSIILLIIWLYLFAHEPGDSRHIGMGTLIGVGIAVCIGLIRLATMPPPDGPDWGPIPYYIALGILSCPAGFAGGIVAHFIARAKAQQKN